ncbi:ABC transporter substrate-binding protein [Variovorax sp. dw_308]|uniref:ABC transporter substrate-binding protein n=1 Tax=Variovorax sp. dw_308 TaxID=2721546 RepID=UPI001C4669ED|nr:ABC transporter substrate-binding protein [Variovorax sp. dw_308]
MDRRSFVLATGAGVALGCGSVVHASESGKDIVIGQSAVLSGALGPSVLLMQSGGRLVFDEVNAQGGIGGRKLNLIALDDAFNPATAQANYKTLIEKHNALACYCGVGAAPTLAGLPLLRASDTPLVGATAVVDSVRDKSEGVAYYTRANQQREAATLVAHLDTLGIERIAVAYIGTPGGEEVLAQIKQAAAKTKVAIVGAVPVAPDASNAAAGGKALAPMQAQATILYLTAGPAVSFIQSARANGATPTFYGMSILAGEVAAKLLGDQSRGIAISQVTPYPWDSSQADSVRFRELAQKANVPVGYHSYEGYISARILVQAMRAAGRDLTRASLHSSLRKLKTRVATLNADFTGGRITGSEFVELVQVRPDGKFLR